MTRALILPLIVLILYDGGSAPAQEGIQLAERDVYHEYGYVSMKDGVRLASAVWRPKKEGRYPTLLTYDSNNAGGLPFRTAKPFLEAGYAVVGVNVRGTGCSEGTHSMRGPKEGPDGAAVVEWAAAQPWSTGNIGMFGCCMPRQLGRSGGAASSTLQSHNSVRRGRQPISRRRDFHRRHAPLK